jgi:type IX secretion system PorP/SprF family membrane protein
MKKLYTLILSVLTVCAVQAQDIPLFTQKLTNSFIYNPAVAGHNVGSLTYSYRMSYAGVSNGPKSQFVSAHAPIAGHRVGIGINAYQEDINFIKNTYLSAAFSYHLRMGKYSSLSFGVSGEYNFMALSQNSNSDLLDPEYLNLASGNVNDYDFSFGMLFQNRFVKAGVAANRLATAWIKDENQYVLSNYYSGFLQGMIPIRSGNDMLEPSLTYRKFSETNSVLDLGLYYTCNNLFMLGGAVRQGNIGSVSAGVNIGPKLFIGYTRDMFFGEMKGFAGATNEFTLRFDFNKYDYRASFSDNYKQALALRRKTMSTNRPGTRSPGQMHRQQKKLSSFSPNKRYQNVKKLSVTPTSQRYKAKSNKYRKPKKRKGRR